jgi:hypothetical protein
MLKLIPTAIHSCGLAVSVTVLEYSDNFMLEQLQERCGVLDRY